MIRIGLVTALSLLAAACGSAPHEITLYLKRDIGSSVPPGQIAPVLAPTVRRVDSQPPSPARVLALLQQGPTSDEADDGFLPTIPSSVHILGVRVSDGTATVNFGGSAPQAFYTHAASSRSPICPGSTRWPCVTTASPAASTPLMGRSPPPRMTERPSERTSLSSNARQIGPAAAIASSDSSNHFVVDFSQAPSHFLTIAISAVSLSLPHTRRR